MERITVRMQPLPRETRLLVTAGRDEAMRRIAGVTASQQRAAARLPEGLPHARSAALCADVPASSFATRMFDDLGIGTIPVHLEVEIAFPAQARRGPRINGFGRFGDLLRLLCLEGVTS